MSSIRVTYSGLIALIIGLSSVITGLVFTLIVTRRLSPEEFGLWAIIGSMISYFIISELVISYWATRQIARGEKVGKTAISTSSVFSIIAIPIYLGLALFVSNVSPEYLNSLILGVLLLPLNLISQTLASINLGHKPQANSYGLMAFEAAKIPSGLILVYFLDLGLDGAILATVIAFSLKIITQFYFAKNQIRVKFSISVLKKWIKNSWIPIYHNLGSFIWKFDVILYSMITGSVLGIAFFAASVAVTQLIAHANLVSSALYPKLVGKGSLDHITENLNLLMFFSIPLLTIVILFSKPALFTLNPEYSDAYLIVIIMAFREFFYVITGVLHKIMIGTERVDEKENPHFKELIKSKLFFSPTIRNIHYFIYVISITLVFYILSQQNSTDLEIVTYWAIIAFSLQLIFFGIMLFYVKRQVMFKLPIKGIIKYIGASGAFSLVYFMTSDLLINYNESIFEFLPGLIIQAILCMITYISTTLIIDKKIRILASAIMKEILGKS